MVFLRHPLLGPPERLHLRSATSDDGPCLILEYPGGRRAIRRFDSDAALTQGAARLHAELMRDGWESLERGA